MSDNLLYGKAPRSKTKFQPPVVDASEQPVIEECRQQINSLKADAEAYHNELAALRKNLSEAEDTIAKLHSPGTEDPGDSEPNHKFLDRFREVQQQESLEMMNAVCK